MHGTSSSRVVPGLHIQTENRGRFSLIEQLECRRLLSGSLDMEPVAPVLAPSTGDLVVDRTVHTVRIGYLIPSNRTAQPDAVPKIQGLMKRLQGWYLEQMEHNGFPNRTLRLATELDGVTPKVEIFNLAQTDSYLRGDGTADPGMTMWSRVNQAATDAGVPIWQPGSVWLLITEAHEMLEDGTILGGIALGAGGGSGNDAGVGMVGSAIIPLCDLEDLSDTRKYDGLIIPEIGPYPLVQNKSFVWFEGDTIASVASSWQGAAWHELSHGFGFGHNFMNDTDGGNLMGNGLRSIRGNYFPDLFPTNYTRFSYSNALAANVSRYFGPHATWTDNTRPTISNVTSGAVSLTKGQLKIDFTATDNTELVAAHLAWRGQNVGAMKLSGTSFTGSFYTPYFDPGVDNQYTLSAYDGHGNLLRYDFTVRPPAGQNVAPRPHLSILPGDVLDGVPVTLNASASSDPNGDALKYEWDFDGDGVFDTAPSTNPVVSHTFAAGSNYLVHLRVTDSAGNSALAEPIGVRPEEAPVQQSVYLSDLNWTSAVSPYYSGARKNLSVAGNPLRIGGQAYAKGVGVHSPSQLTYNLAGQYARFTAMVGIDDEVGNSAIDGTAVFQVWGDGKLLKQSTRRTGADGAEYLDVDVTGIQQLKLITTTGGDNDWKDHADWADAKLHRGVAVAKPVVTLTASKNTLSEDGLDRIDLTLTRTGDLAQPLSVPLTFSGVAEVGTDYLCPASAWFAAGASEVTVSIGAYRDSIDEPDESARVAIAPSDAYTLGGSTSADFTVIDDDDPPPAQNVVSLCDLNWASASCPFGGVQKDTSIAGNPLRIGGQSFAHGLGVHAPAEIVYNIGGNYSRFTAMVGIDDEVGNSAIDGTAVFQVWGDGKLLKQSTRRTGADGAEYLDVDVTGIQQLKLITTTGGDNDYKDHADWVDAKLYASTTPDDRPVITIAADKNTLNEDAVDRIRLTFTRTGSVTESLTAGLTFTGAAQIGTDYLVPHEVYFEHGQSTAELFIAAYRDDLVEGNELATIAITPGPHIQLGTASQIQFTLIDDDQPAVTPKYLSDLTPTRAVSPYGGLQKDRSNGGRTITIGGKTYAKGLGVHSRSEVEYAMGGAYTRFSSAVGIDDEVGNGATDGTAVFEVWVDGVLKKSSTRRTGADPAELIEVDLTGAQTLRLVTTTGGDSDYKDHADWADAKVM